MGLFLTLIVAAGLMLVVQAISLAIFMPFIGSLIRLRANYNPRAVGFDTGPGKDDNHVGPRLTGIISTLKRTYRLEGPYGLYKGVFAAYANLTLMSLLALIFIGSAATRGPKGTYHVPDRGGFGFLILPFFLVLVSLPLFIIENRAVITPYRLPWNVKQSLQVLLSPHELERPITLYSTPGLLPAVGLRAFCTTVLAHGMRRLFVGTDTYSESTKTWPWIILWIFLASSAAWLTPLEVVIAKLSVQPNLGSVVSVDDPEGGDDTPEGLRFAGTDEDVVGLRPTSDPYVGFVDAIRKIIDEEGWQALYRGWWWTALASLGLLSG